MYCWVKKIKTTLKWSLHFNLDPKHTKKRKKSTKILESLSLLVGLAVVISCFKILQYKLVLLLYFKTKQTKKIVHTLSSRVLWSIIPVLLASANINIEYILPSPVSLPFRAIPMAHGGSQARGCIGATAACLHHSHSHVGPKLCLQPILQLMAMLDP